MLLNLDIWLEILSYLDYEEDEDTLRSLAVTCHTLSNLALDVIWRNCDASASIASVANSFAHSPFELFLYYVKDYYDDNGGGAGGELGINWVLNKPLPSSACNRTLEYLARIRSLVVDQRGSADNSIWPILSVCLDSYGPLLPNLKRLEIAFHIYNHIDYILPLLSPSIKFLLISLYARPPKQCFAISTVLNFAKVRGCDLEDFVYFGNFTDGILEAIMLFKNLQNVEFALGIGPNQEVSITIVEFLASLPSLCSLTCDITDFSPPMDEDRFCHTSLQKIKIQAKTQMLTELFHICVFPSVTDVGIQIDDEVQSFSGLESSCPNARKLNLNLFPFRLGTSLRFEQLAPLLSLPIETFSLDANFHDLAPSNLRTFAESWPNLCYFRIRSCTQFDPLPSLAAFSNHPRLDYFKVHLPLCRLLSDIPELPNLMGTYVAPRGGRSRLRTLRFRDFPCDRQPPVVTAAEKRMLVEYMLLLFPSLERFKFLDRHSHGALFREEQVEFQNILSELVV